MKTRNLLIGLAFLAVLAAQTALATVATPAPDNCYRRPPGDVPGTNGDTGIRLSQTTFCSTKGILGDDYRIFKTQNENTEVLNLELTYSSDNASGTSGQRALDTGVGFGWRHTYDIFLVYIGSDIFKLSSTGLVTKYPRLPDGTFTTLAGNQQTIRQVSKNIFEITNRAGGKTFRFERFDDNPRKIIDRNPFMLTAITDRNGNVTRLDYQNGWLTQVTDTYGRQIKFGYDANNHLSKITDPLNRVSTLEYNANNDLAKIIDPLGSAVTYDYRGSSHLISKKTHKNGNFSTYSYTSGLITGIKDQTGAYYHKLANPINWARNQQDHLKLIRTYIPSVTTITDGNGRKSQHFYNSNAQITKEVAPNGAITTYTYDPATLNMASKTDAKFHSTHYQYDAFGNLILQTDALGNTTVNEYDNPFNFVTKTSVFAAGSNEPFSVIRYEYDSKGNRIREVRDLDLGVSLTKEWTYDAKGHVISETDANGHKTQYGYDAFGNRNLQIDAEGKITRTEYDAIGNKLKETDASGNTWTYGPYDGMDRLLAETDPLGYTTDYKYDGNGNRLEVNKKVSSTEYQFTRYSYDHRNRLISRILDPSDGSPGDSGKLNLTTAYGYDNNNNRIRQTDPRGNITRYSYDSANRLGQVTDAYSRSTTLFYDANGNRRCVYDANGHATVFSYDALNRVIRETRKIGTQSCATGDADDLVTQTFYDRGADIDPTHCRSYLCGGPAPGSVKPAKVIDPEGKYTYFKYDRANRKILTIRKIGDISDHYDRSANTPNDNDWGELIRYDGADNVTRRTDANGKTTTYTYFKNNWLASETNADDETTLYTYTNAGKLRTVQSPGGNFTVNTYNKRNELILVYDSEGPVAGIDLTNKPGFKYDGIGNRIQTCDGNGNCTRNSYDAANRMVATTDAMGETTRHVYDKAGNLVNTTDRENHATCYAYDKLNRRTLQVQKVGDSDCGKVDGDDIWAKTKYDAVGNVVALMTASSKNGGFPSTCDRAAPSADCQITRYMYDEVNRLVQEAYPRRAASDTVKNTREYSYDRAGNLIRRIDQKNLATDYVYNDLYYLIKRDYQNDPDDTFKYDFRGRMLTAERDGWLDTFIYDAEDRLVESQQNGKIVGYTHDIPNRTRTVTYPSGKVVVEARDLRERLSKVNNGTVAAYSYDSGNRVTSRLYGNGTESAYSYNANNWITGLNHSKTGGDLIAGFDYAHDREGNKRYEQKLHDAAKSQGFAYDDLYRLVHYKVGEVDNAGFVSLPLTQTQYDLDKLGNWDKKIKDGNAETREHNNVNELIKINGDGLDYDANGNLVKDSQYDYIYNQENQLTNVTFVGATGVETAGEYRYDALGRRVAKLTGVSRGNRNIRYYYDNARIIEEQNAAGTALAAYTYGNYVDEVLAYDKLTGARAGRYFVYSNHLYSPEVLVNDAGHMVEQYRYDAYGQQEILDASGNKIAKSQVGFERGFTGYGVDRESGLLYARARMYSPILGRFNGRDPLGYYEGYSLYSAYFIPNGLDPIGLMTYEECIQVCKDDANKEREEAKGMCDGEQKALNDAEQSASAFAQEMLTRYGGALGAGGLKTGLENSNPDKPFNRPGAVNNTLLSLFAIAVMSPTDMEKLGRLAKEVARARDALRKCEAKKQQRLTSISFSELMCMLDCEITCPVQPGKVD